MPDIVTMGKPFGNGFPRPMFSTQTIAESFANGLGTLTLLEESVACAAGLAVLETVQRRGFRRTLKGLVSTSWGGSDRNAWA